MRDLQKESESRVFGWGGVSRDGEFFRCVKKRDNRKKN